MTLPEDLKIRMRTLAVELSEEYGRSYVMFALKKIRDRQLLELDIPVDWRGFDPILKVSDAVLKELESTLFESNDGISDISQIREIIADLIHVLPKLPAIVDGDGSTR
ncbi:hypothetical protein JXA40_06515 [bacterium]|nr:hypothetical protein [candidate division CSSED10-310 bacterium]